MTVTEARKFTEHEVQTLYLQQWEHEIGKGRAFAIGAFQRLKRWVGPSLWDTLLNLEFTEQEWYELLNALPRGMVDKVPSKRFIAMMLLYEPKRFISMAEVAPMKGLPKRPTVTAAGNVLRLQFGKQNSKDDSTDQ